MPPVRPCAVETSPPRNAPGFYVVEGVALLEELSSTARRVFGTAHPTTICIDGNLGRARSELASLTAP